MRANGRVRVPSGWSIRISEEEQWHQRQGQILEENESKLRLRPADPDEEVVELDVDEVDLRKKGMSSMPADLIERLDARDLRALVEFLATRVEK